MLIFTNIFLLPLPSSAFSLPFSLSLFLGDVLEVEPQRAHSCSCRHKHTRQHKPRPVLHASWRALALSPCAWKKPERPCLGRKLSENRAGSGPLCVLCCCSARLSLGLLHKNCRLRIHKTGESRALRRVLGRRDERQIHQGKDFESNCGVWDWLFFCDSRLRALLLLIPYFPSTLFST